MQQRRAAMLYRPGVRKTSVVSSRMALARVPVSLRQVRATERARPPKVRALLPTWLQLRPRRNSCLEHADSQFPSDGEQESRQVLRGGTDVIP